MAAKELMTQVKLQVPAGSANPAPPVGPALGQHGLNIQDFCKQFNDKTKDAEKGMALPVVINVYKDRSFDFVIKSAPAAALLKKAAGIQKGSATPHTNKVAKITKDQLADIVKAKEGDLTGASLENVVKWHPETDYLGNHRLSNKKFIDFMAFSNPRTLKQGIRQSWQSIKDANESYNPLKYLDQARDSDIDLKQFFPK